MKALIVSAEGFEDTELLVPYYRFLEEGIETDIASITKGRIKGKHGYEVEVFTTLADVAADEYDVLLLPGGRAPAAVRKEETALELARDFFRKNKPAAAICHGPQVLISAGLLKGRRATCYRTVADELKGAGARYEDAPVVVDGTLVTSRQPSDLPAFLREVMKLIRARAVRGAA
jgi:protease I